MITAEQIVGDDTQRSLGRVYVPNPRSREAASVAVAASA